MVGIGQGQWWDSKLVLGSHMQSLPTGYEHVEPWTGGEQVRDLNSSARHLLEVVQEQQQLLLLQSFLEAFQQRLPGCFLNAQYLSDGGDDQRGITERGQIHEKDPISE